MEYCVINTWYWTLEYIFADGLFGFFLCRLRYMQLTDRSYVRFLSLLDFQIYALLLSSKAFHKLWILFSLKSLSFIILFAYFLVLLSIIFKKFPFSIFKYTVTLSAKVRQDGIKSSVPSVRATETKQLCTNTGVTTSGSSNDPNFSIFLCYTHGKLQVKC